MTIPVNGWQWGYVMTFGGTAHNTIPKPGFSR